MAAATSEITLELHGALADRFAALGTRRGTRTRIPVAVDSQTSVADLLNALVARDKQYAHLFDATTGRLPEHIEAVLNDRVLELQGGMSAPLKPGDVLTFIPAHAGG
jgi:molybdopterin converting factor small subunit